MRPEERHALDQPGFPPGFPIDRVAPTRRPGNRRAVGYQTWRDLLFLHWPVPAETLRPLVPARLSLDLYEGAAYVGVIPFAITGARWIGTPPALGLPFLETNVRTYVHLDGECPGVYFFSLDASSPLAVIGARLGFGLPYFLAEMTMRRREGVVEYALRRRSLRGGGPGLAVRYEVGAELGASRPGTLEHFLIERYLLYVERRRAGGLWTTQVHHSPYPVQRARLLSLDEDLTAAAGLAVPATAPLAHYSRGVAVEVFAPRRPVGLRP